MGTTAHNRAKFFDRIAFSLTRRAVFYADLARFMDSRIPPFKAIEKMEVVARRRRKTRALAKIYRAILRDMQRGKLLANAVGPWIPGHEAVMLAGSENVGPAVLIKTLQELSALLERQQRARGKLRGALMSNGFAMATIFGIIFMVVKEVIPKLIKSEMRGMQSKMPFTEAFFRFGHDFITYGVFWLAGFIAISLFIGWTLPNWSRDTGYLSRAWFDRHVMPWTLYRRMQATFFLSTAAAMMRSGIPLKDVLTGSIPFASRWTRVRMREVLRKLDLGKPEVEALDTGMLPEETSDRLMIYAAMDDFTEIMTRLSEDNFVMYEKTINGVSELLKLIALLAMAIFSLSLLGSIFQYSNAIQSAVHAMRAAMDG